MERARNQELLRIWSRIVAKAWADEDFKKKLLTHPTETLQQNGFSVLPQVKYVILEDTEDHKNIVLHESSEHFEYQHEEIKKTWIKLLQKVKSDKREKEKLLAHPKKIMQLYGIPLAPGVSYTIIEDTKALKYLVLVQPPPNFLSEIELEENVIGGKACGSAGFCTDTSSA